jgi:hypothetical protein
MLGSGELHLYGIRGREREREKVRCQRFGERYCLFLQGLNGDAGKWRIYIGPREEREEVSVSEKHAVSIF